MSSDILELNRALRAEQMRSAGGGLLLGNLAVEEEERGR